MNPILRGIIRHILTAVGGALATQGYLSSGEVELLVGAIMTIIGVGLSIWAKRT